MKGIRIYVYAAAMLVAMSNIKLTCKDPCDSYSIDCTPKILFKIRVDSTDKGYLPSEVSPLMIDVTFIRRSGNIFYENIKKINSYEGQIIDLTTRDSVSFSLGNAYCTIYENIHEKSPMYIFYSDSSLSDSIWFDYTVTANKPYPCNAIVPYKVNAVFINGNRVPVPPDNIIILEKRP